MQAQGRGFTIKTFAEENNLHGQGSKTLPCNQVCEMLDKAGVPADLNWRAAINFFRELENDPRYSTEQKKQFHLNFIEIIKGQKFTPETLREINFRIEYIRHIYCVEKENSLKKQLLEKEKLLDSKDKLLDSLLKTYADIVEDGLHAADDKIGDVDKLKDSTVQALQNNEEKEKIIEKVSQAAGAMVDKIVRESTRLREKADEAEKWKQKAKALEFLATTDQLTQLYNRRAFDDYMNEMIKDIVEHAKPLSMILIDIDHFKKFNDEYGHDIGDEVLRLVASVIKRNANREGDFTARYGGEEMVVVCEGLDLEQTTSVAEAIRKDIEGYQFIVRGPKMRNVRITVSSGVAQLSREWGDLPDSEFDQLPEDTGKASVYKIRTKLFKAADNALYRAKNSGRNRVCVHE